MKDFFYQIKKTDLSENAVFDVLQTMITEDSIIEQIPKKELAQISTFLWQVKHYRALKFFLVSCFNKPGNIPGNALFHFVHFFRHSNPEVNAQVFVDLNDYLNIVKTHNTPFTIHDKVFEEAKTQQLEIFERRYNEIKTDLVDKLEFARTQRLDKEAKKTLDKLLEAFPNDPRFVNEKQKLFEKEAARIIETHSKRKKSRSATPSILEFKKESTSPIYHLFKDSFNDENMIHLIEAFILAHENETVVEIFEQHPELKTQHFWLYIEHLIKIERYLEALAELRKHQETQGTMSDSIFTFYYYHAICLWYLNDKKHAIEIMKAIQKTKPDFRQTSFYLNLWQHHDQVG
ncbi:MAG: hypothetical protein M9899_06475 [Bdellovibrionaceae bacterium]|nr:hypothetical protein [Pseudobdellovibrionaceae bacterium]